MSKINIGNKLLCDNGYMYTLVEGDGFYEFGLLNKSGKIVDYVAEGHLEDCLPFEPNDEDCDCQSALCVGVDEDGLLAYTYIVDVIK